MFKLISISIVFLVFYEGLSYSQEYFSVIAENGLILRNQPDVNSIRIGKLECGEDVTLLEKTNYPFEVLEEDTIKGFWYKVATNRTKGYVFSGYLMEKILQPTYYSNRDTLFKSSASNSKFELSIYQHDFEVYDKNSSDTIYIDEFVFENVDDRLLSIHPKHDIKNIKVFYSKNETLTYVIEGRRESLKGVSNFVELPKKNSGFFRIPIESGLVNEGSWASTLNLERAPDWNGEGWWVPRYYYQNISAGYHIPSILLKVVITNLDGTMISSVVHLTLSYGC